MRRDFGGIFAQTRGGDVSIFTQVGAQKVVAGLPSLGCSLQLNDYPSRGFVEVAIMHKLLVLTKRLPWQRVGEVHGKSASVASRLKRNSCGTSAILK